MRYFNASERSECTVRIDFKTTLIKVKLNQTSYVTETTLSADLVSSLYINDQIRSELLFQSYFTPEASSSDSASLEATILSIAIIKGDSWGLYKWSKHCRDHQVKRFLAAIANDRIGGIIHGSLFLKSSG